jgi:hypothetical protein
MGTMIGVPNGARTHLFNPKGVSSN